LSGPKPKAPGFAGGYLLRSFGTTRFLFGELCVQDGLWADYLGHKPADPAGKGTIVVDNIASAISVNDGSAAARIDHNLVRSGARAGDISGSPAFVGGTSPSTWSGFQLASTSLGVNAASDGPNLGSRIFGASASASAPRAGSSVATGVDLPPSSMASASPR